MSQNSNAAKPFVSSEIDPQVIAQVSKLVTDLTGIQLGEKQYSMVENRLKSRMIRLGISEARDYLKYLKDNSETESQALVSLMTTHHTYFFREFTHFEFLLNEAFPKLIKVARARADKKIKIWSSACSRGHEVYSLAMFCDFHLKTMAPDVSYEIVGTDVDPESVSVAKNGVYAYADLKKVPLNYMGQHWARGTGAIESYVKVKSALKDKCKFEVGNLLADNPKLAGQTFDIIFCRNVFIYFNQDQIKEITQRLLKSLDKSGYLFVGISETLNGLLSNINYVGPSIYQFKEAVPTPAPAASSAAPAPKGSIPPAGATVVPLRPATTSALPLRVLCVDDSNTILMLLKKILTKDNGFEVVATAMNGKEAHEALKTHKIDVMTLDIHMPEMDGVTYLKTYMSNSHVPVIMLSTVNRDNADVALKTLELGAQDYVEKPTMANLTERADEIRSKLRMAVQFRAQKSLPTNVDQEFKRSYQIKDPEKKTRVIYSGLSHRKQIQSILSTLTKKDPATVFVFEGSAEATRPLAAEFQNKTGLKVNFLESWQDLKVGEIYFMDLEKVWNSHLSKIAMNKISALVLGIPTQKVIKSIETLKPNYLVLEDLGDIEDKNYELIRGKAKTVAPATSYVSISEENF